MSQAVNATISQGVVEAQEASDKRTKVELILGPDQPQFWGYLGLDKGQVFELTLVCIDGDRMLSSMRNTTELSRLQQAHLRAAHVRDHKAADSDRARLHHIVIGATHRRVIRCEEQHHTR